MALKASTGLRNKLLTSLAFKEIFGNGDATHKAEIRIYSGAAPATADAAATGTLLCSVKAGSNGVTFADAANGIILKTPGESWAGTISNSGALSAGYYRLVEGSVDDGSDSTSLARVQGNVGTTATADTQLTVANVVLPDGEQQVIDIYQIEFPSA